MKEETFKILLNSYYGNINHIIDESITSLINRKLMSDESRMIRDKKIHMVAITQ